MNGSKNYTISAADIGYNINFKVTFTDNLGYQEASNYYRYLDHFVLGDTVSPTVMSFSFTTMDGSYIIGDKNHITATMSEAVTAGSTFDVTLDTEAQLR